MRWAPLYLMWSGPKILGKATTALSDGLMAKIGGTGSIDFTKIGRILLFVLALYLGSAIFNFVQGWIMTGITQKICYRLRKEISEKINRMPMKYFESRTYGEVLSRITNDVDTLGMGLNQSVTMLITSVSTLIGVFIMMLSISPLMTLIAVVILPVSMLLISTVVKTFPEILPFPAGILRTYQWTGGRGLWWTSGCESVQPRERDHRGIRPHK